MINSTSTKAIVSSFLAASFLVLFTVQPAAAKTTKKIAPSTASVSSDSDLRLALDKVNLDANTGHLDEAFDELQALEAKYPNNADVLATASDLYLQMDNRGMAYSQASQASFADAEGVTDHERAAALGPKGRYVSGGYNDLVTNEADQNIFSLSGQTDVAPGLVISGVVQNDHINTRLPLMRPNGIASSFYGNRQQGSVTADKIFNDGQEVLGSLYANNAAVGGGGEYRLWDRYGSTSIALDYNRPRTDYIEMAVENGTQHDVIIKRKQIFTSDIQGGIDAKYTHYSLDHVWNAAEAPGWDLNLDIAHPFDWFGATSVDDHSITGPITLGVHYDVEAEYFGHVDHEVSSTGGQFAPLPVQNYEVHTFTASAAKDLFPGFNVEGDIGIGVNRMTGGSGPVYGILANYQLVKDLAISFHANRNLLGGENNAEKEENIGVDLKLNF